MALIKCPECQREISDQAPACPGCGVLIKAPKPVKAHVVYRGSGCAVFLIGCLGVCLLLLFPIGTILGLLCFVFAWVIGNRPKRFCSRCTKPVGKGEWTCPHCLAEFEDFK